MRDERRHTASANRIDLEVLAFVQFVGNLVAVWGSYQLVVWLRTFTDDSYQAANLQALRVLLPWILGSYAILYVIYEIGSRSLVDPYELILGQLATCLLVGLVSVAGSYMLRAFALPRSVVLASAVIQMVSLTGINYAFLRIRGLATAQRQYICIARDDGYAENLARSLEANGCRTRTMLIDAAMDPVRLVKTVMATDVAIVLAADVDMDVRSGIARAGALSGIPVLFEPTACSMLVKGARVSVLGDHEMLQVSPIGLESGSAFLKRVLDIVFALVALVVFSPLMVISSLAILVESGRPVLFRQDRLGLDGRVFGVLKLRTMIQDAEVDTGACLAVDGDPRITRVGRLLRRTGLDEVPQFLNVLRGDMSVVGPRPERPELVEKIRRDVPDYDLRLMVKPGITGLAQIRGRYDTTPADKLNMDLAYIGNRRYALSQDLRIIFNTLKMFFLPARRK